MNIVGIDLGTTNSLVSIWQEDGPIIIPNVFGKNLTPSVISIDENNEVLVGEVAKERLITKPERTVSCFKRMMGTDKIYQLGEHSFRPEELSAYVLKSLKEDAEVYLGKEVTRAVISVPAYFNDKQRNATKKAAELAGFIVERLINEPTAAAIAFGLADPEQESKFMVLDLGGGTFDVSILEMFDGIMEVHAIAGDNYLGGEDFTNVLITYFMDKKGLSLQNLTLEEQSIFYKQAEQEKYALSQKKAARLHMVYHEKELELEVSPAEYEVLCMPLLNRFLRPIERAMRDTSFSKENLDNVILIGGATRSPYIRNYVSKMFGKLPYVNINPDETVALGAAIQAAMKERKEALKEIVLTDVCPFSLGVETVKVDKLAEMTAGHFCPIIERNTTIPVSRVERFQTVQDNQSALNFKIFQGESRLTDSNLKLGEMVVKIPKHDAGVEMVDVRFTYDINGILEVEATICSTGITKRIIIQQNPGELTMDEIDRQLTSLKGLKLHPRDKMENKLLLERGNRMYEEALGELRNYLGNILSNFERVLETQNDYEIRKEAKRLLEILNNIDGV